MQIAAIILFVAFIVWLSLSWKRKSNNDLQPSGNAYRKILEDHVLFYRNLDESNKAVFEKRMLQFLKQVTITGVGTKVDIEDRVFVAASAIIPIFAFSNWEYNNLNEVLLYPNAFDQDFTRDTVVERNILGMVGSGAMQHVMVLSRHSLKEGFYNEADKSNTGIHEFVHLIDKTDGDIDGVPENLLDKKYLLPWIDQMHSGIKEILANESDINPYGATNKAEFFAVVSEYFFQRPDMLQEKHPELFKLLQQLFRQRPTGAK